MDETHNEHSGAAASPSDARWSDESLRDLIDYRVVDRDNDAVGTVSAIWEDSVGQPAFLGVRTGWFGLGKTHVIPAHAATWSHAAQTIRLPFTVSVVKQAPTFDEDAQIDPVAESRIYTYYQQNGGTMLTRPTAGASASQNVAGQGQTGAETTVIPLREEELVVGKREVDAGGVRLRKIVRTEIVNQPVEVRREEVVIERVPASGEATGDTPFEDKDIYVPLRREEPVVTKQAHVREEVHVRKQDKVDAQQVNEQVRKEDVEVIRDDRPSSVDVNPGS